MNAGNIMTIEKVIFAGGCFWCMEYPFDSLDGVQSVISGYTGGSMKDPSYEDICRGDTGHYEAVEVTFDSDIVSLNELLTVFWQQIDPTDENGQFADRGSQYKTAVFYFNDDQRVVAEKSLEKLRESKRFRHILVTEIKKADVFYKAESYHQKYYKNNGIHYKMYRAGSGRDRFLEKIWKNEK